MPSIQNRSAKVLLAIASTALALGLAELSFRVATPRADRYYPHPPGLRRVFHPDEGLLPGVTGPGVFAVSSDGLRAAERSLADSFRVLAVGGSTTECVYLDQEEAWPARLEQLLNEAYRPRHRAWVGNAGRSGHRTREHLVLLETVLPRLGDIDVVVLLIGGNDLMRRLAESVDYDPVAWRSPEARRRLRERVFRVRPGRSLIDPKGFVLFDLAARVAWRLGGEAVRHRLQLQDKSGKSYERWRRYRANTPELRTVLPNLDSALNEFAVNVDELVAQVRRHRARVVLMTQPSLYRDDLTDREARLLWMGGVGNFNREPGHAYYAAQALARALREYNSVLRRRCRVLAVECIDLVSRIPSSTDAFYDDFHFNERGAELVARALYEHLSARPPFSE